MATDAGDDADDKGGFVGRGGLKLEAAVRLLGGREALRGAKAVDVGASTGGFTECLLKYGAAQVTAVDVGHGQLHERLRADPRVLNLENTNFKTVSLQVAPGPFDAFVVDVSFVSARAMLRPLALRLRPGAEGFILIKPQFELPEGYIHDGEVKAEGLRKWAVQRVKKKGEELGFRLVGTTDSPVLGGSGTVEILSRWRFEGRTGKLAGIGPGAAQAGAAIAPPVSKPYRPKRPQAKPGKPQRPPGRASAAAPQAAPKPAPAPGGASDSRGASPAQPPRKGFGGGYADPSRPRRPPHKPRRR